MGVSEECLSVKGNRLTNKNMNNVIQVRARNSGRGGGKQKEEGKEDGRQ